MTRLSRTFFAALLAATVLASPVPAQDMTDAELLHQTDVSG